jgi:hypothetical protein
MYFESTVGGTGMSISGTHTFVWSVGLYHSHALNCGVWLSTSCSLVSGVQDFGNTQHTYTLNVEAVFSSETPAAICKAAQHTEQEDSNMAAFCLSEEHCSLGKLRVHTAPWALHCMVYNDASQM